MRTDIQVLRGIAIFFVLMYHARIGIFSAGYLGVDIFFVISGFLITTLVSKQINSGSFKFSDFYLRRAKRLLPAAYVIFLLAALLSPFFLTSLEFRDFQKQLLGAITLTGNIALWRQTGYFEGAAELKPLLHVWSLGIEEQYYLIMPALLYFAPSRLWRPGAICVFVISIVACLAVGTSSPATAFYWLPTRAWELAIGSLGALFPMELRFKRLAKIFFWPSILVLIFVPALTLRNGPPGLLTLAVCVATLIVIERNHAIFLSSAWFPLTALGNMSYSLYLVHWPLLAFLTNAWVGEPLPYGMRWAAVVAAVLAAYMLYILVERPIHYMKLDRREAFALTTLAATAMLILGPMAILKSSGQHIDYDFVRRVNYGFGQACEFNTAFAPIPECRDAEAPTVLIWGDSFAMHLVPGISSKIPKLGTVQATRTLCGPLLEVAPIVEALGFNRARSEKCIEFNESVVDYLKRAPSVRLAVLSSPFGQYLNTNNMLLERQGSVLVERTPIMALVVEGIKRTVSAVRALGKKVVVIGPPPGAEFEIGMCLERLMSVKVSFGPFANCQIPTSAYHSIYQPILTFLDQLPMLADVSVIRLDDYLCGADYCRTFEGSVPLYRDRGHLSYDGSVELAQGMHLVAQIQKEAR